MNQTPTIPSRRARARGAVRAALVAAMLSSPLAAPAQSLPAPPSPTPGSAVLPSAPVPAPAAVQRSAPRIPSVRVVAPAQVIGEPPMLGLSANATRDVVDDTALVVLFVERTGAEPGQLQSSVNATLQDALARLRRDPALQVRSGGYFTRPRYARDGRIEGWTVRGELIAESTDTAAISRAAATAGGQMNVGSLGFLLSPARRAQVERELTAEAAARLRERALEAAQALGYAGVELLEANLDGGAPRPPVLLARAGVMAAAPADVTPLPVEPGRSQVIVTFSGTFRLLR